MSYILRAENVSKRFGGITAVNNVSVSIEKGSITALIGPNGAGKTTFLNLISGIFYPDKGKIFFENIDITRKPPHERARLGIARTFQNIGIIQSLSVFDNIKVSIIGSRRHSGLTQLLSSNRLDKHTELNKIVYDILERIGLIGREFRLGFQLTQAEQRILDIAMAISTRPKLLLLDEPTSGAAAEDIPSIIKLLKKLKNDEPELTVLLVEHKLEVVKDLADKVIVMREGSVIAEGSYYDVIRNKDVIEAYIGISDVRDKRS